MQRRSARNTNLLQPSIDQLAELERTNRARRRAQERMENAHNNHQGGAAGAQQPTIEQLMEEIRLLRLAQERNNQEGRPIGEYGVPHNFFQNRSAICPTPLGNEDYEIKPQLIALVKQHTFHGLPAENPMDHVENFEEICSTARANGVPQDFLKCKLFPFSLADKASKWLKSLPPASFTNWNDCRAAFVDQFFSKSKTASLRSKIISFEQLSGEPFHEAWDRFKDYQRDCPHHGYSEEQLLGTFYDGVAWEHRNALDAASNGDFMTRGTNGALRLIENLAASSSNRSKEYDRSRKPTSVDSKRIDELNEKITLLMKESRENRRGVHALEEVAEPTPYYGDLTFDDQGQEVSYIGGQGYGQNRGFNQGNQNYLSYRSTNVANPQDQYYPPRQQQRFQPLQATQNQGFRGSFGQQQQPQRQFAPNNGFQGNYEQRRRLQPEEIIEVKEMLKQMMEQQQRDADLINKQLDELQVAADEKFGAISTHLKLLDKQVMQQTAEAIRLLRNRKDTVVYVIGDDGLRRRLGKGGEIDESFAPEPVSEMMLPGRVASFRRIKVPETGEATFALKDEKEESFAVKEDGAERKHAKEGMSNEVSEVIEKQEDPGRLELQIKIGETSFENCLCDLGATVNLMNKATADVLGMADYAPSPRNLKFADHSVKAPVGTLEDVQVKVGGSCIPADFVVLDAGNFAKDPIILGRPFLNTAGAKINVQKGQVELHLEKGPEVRFEKKELKQLEETIETVETKSNSTQDLEQGEEKKEPDKEEGVHETTYPDGVTEQDEKPPDIAASDKEGGPTGQSKEPPDLPKSEEGGKRRRRRKRASKKPSGNITTQTFKKTTLEELHKAKQPRDQQVGRPPTRITPVPDRGKNYTTKGRQKRILDPYNFGIFDLHLERKTPEGFELKVQQNGRQPKPYDTIKVIVQVGNEKGEERFERKLRDKGQLTVDFYRDRSTGKEHLVLFNR